MNKLNVMNVTCVVTLNLDHSVSVHTRTSYAVSLTQINTACLFVVAGRLEHGLIGLDV